MIKCGDIVVCKKQYYIGRAIFQNNPCTFERWKEYRVNTVGEFIVIQIGQDAYMFHSGKKGDSPFYPTFDEFFFTPDELRKIKLKKLKKL